MNAWRWIIAAATVFAVLELAEDFVALPLRHASSTIAGLVLRLAGYAIEQHGTIIATSRFTFDVVPACSGSTTLQVLLTLGCIWVGQHAGLGGWRRPVTLAAAVAIAVLANGLRVAVLVALGDLRLEPVEGALHDAIGISTFLIALGSLVLLSEVLARRATAAPAAASVSGRLHWWAAGAALVLMAAPVAVWALNAWMTSPLDAWGWLAWVLAIVCLVPLRNVSGGIDRPALTMGLAALGALVALAGAAVDVSSLQALGVLILLAAALSLGGTRRLLCGLPAVGLIGLGMPVVGFVVTTLSGWSGPLASLVLRGAIAVALVSLAILLRRRAPAVEGTPWRHPGVPLIAVLVVAVSLQLGLAVRRAAVVVADLSFSYLQGAWVGHDVPISASTDLLLGGRNVVQRRYRDDDGIAVDVIVTRTGGDRHRAHPPEYCLTGAGWTIAATTSEHLLLANGNTVEARILDLHRHEDHCVFTAWFSDGEQTVPSFSNMLLIDAGRRLAGRRTDWVLVRVIAPEAAHLHRFLADFAPPAAPERE